MPGRWNGLWSAASCLRWFGGTLFLYLFHGGDQASQADLDGTQLKIDEISNLGAIKIRLRSLIAAMEQIQKQSPAEPAEA